MNMLLLLVLQLHVSYCLTDGFPQVVSNRQQHFEHDTIRVSCEGLNGLNGWRVLRRVKDVVKPCAPTWEKSTGPCTITAAYTGIDSGEYWCEMGGIERSNSVNITVTSGSVILESPVLPVMEGDNVTLRCRAKQTSSGLSATFYRDGVIMESTSRGEITIESVSKSYEGLYKCSIRGAGESPESWLTVRAHHEDSHLSPTQLFLYLAICVSVLLVSLLVLMGLLRCSKDQTTTRDAPTSASCSQPLSPSQTVSGQASVAGTQQATYAVITIPRKDNVSGQASVAGTQQATYAVIKKPRKDNDPGASGCSATPGPFAGTGPLLPKEDPFYCTID